MTKKGDYQVELRSYIATQLEKKRLSQKEFAERLSKDPATINNWMRGRQSIPLELLDSIADALEEKTPLHVYQSAGLLARLPGTELVKLVQDLPIDQLRVLESMVRAFVEAQKH